MSVDQGRTVTTKIFGHFKNHKVYIVIIVTLISQTQKTAYSIHFAEKTFSALHMHSARCYRSV